MRRREFIKIMCVGAGAILGGRSLDNYLYAKERSKMKIQAVKLYENGFMTEPFALGGEGREGYDPNLKFRSCLQNYVIDTGSEVILVDTGMPKETPDMSFDEKTEIYIGSRIKDYVSALKEVGYTPDDVDKILITHKHADHTGELRSFPKAKIYASAIEAKADEIKSFSNVIPVEFTDGAYYNFPKSQKIADGVYYIEAIGHTTGNSIVIVESDGLFYMIHGDVTYTDEALYKNTYSVVFEDAKAQRETVDRVREFISAHPTVYLSTHTPLGYENLENKTVIDLNNPPKVIPPGEFVYKTKTGKYICSVCGYVYDPAVGDEANGIPAGTKFEDLPADWHCPRCKQAKTNFNPA